MIDLMRWSHGNSMLGKVGLQDPSIFLSIDGLNEPCICMKSNQAERGKLKRVERLRKRHRTQLARGHYFEGDLQEIVVDEDFFSLFIELEF